ncbi:uncharacterized protein RSE6_11845 [Rhynchosporium secalis]|uniref:Uncharacterized protein n=1 Tax=Rhynchosporium secalis TaxID=38038 RepID=A0A1E1MNY0_RHYSE|nr:uncharacterized protein RSE6_11845 [Rhynchosporium secalis]
MDLAGAHHHINPPPPHSFLKLWHLILSEHLLTYFSQTSAFGLALSLLPLPPSTDGYTPTIPSTLRISTSAYEQPKTPKTIQNKKSKNIILTPVASPSPSKSDILSPVSYRSPSPFSPSSDLSESLWIKDPFKSKFHAVRADESCDCSKCDAALDADVSCSITMYSAESDEESVVMDDSSLIPILEPCIAFNFIPSTVESVPSTSSILSSFTVPGAFPILDAEVEDDSGARWVPSAVALGVAVVGMAVAWFWVPYKVWRSRSRMGVMAQGS